MNVLLSYGYFVFSMQSVPFHEFIRTVQWRQATNDVLGRMPKTQFLGKQNESITLSAVLMPEVTGGAVSLRLLEKMADEGKPYPLISGVDFSVLGWFVVESFNEKRMHFFNDGAPRKIEFDMTLKRTDDAVYNPVSKFMQDKNNFTNFTDLMTSLGLGEE